MAHPRSLVSGAAALAAALVLSSLPLLPSCGGSAGPAGPTLPSPTPIPTPTPDPNIPPVGSGCGQPYPPKITRFVIKVSYKLKDYWIVDSTPLVGVDGAYCAAIGFTDGRLICPIRPEGRRTARPARSGGRACRRTRRRWRVRPGRCRPRTESSTTAPASPAAASTSPLATNREGRSRSRRTRAGSTPSARRTEPAPTSTWSATCSLV